MAWGRRRSRSGEVLDSICSAVALVVVLVAYVELGDAAAVVDVYRLIQYDIAGEPFGSRLAALNHHAGLYPFAPGADLSRTVVIIPVQDLNVTFLREYITNRKPLGGLLLLLPQKVSDETPAESTDDHNPNTDGLTRNLLTDLERLLVHATFHYPVYFAFEDEGIVAVLSDVRRSDAAGHHVTATTGGLVILQLEDFVGGLRVLED